MRILQFLKNIFSRKKIKAITAPQEETKESIPQSEENSFIDKYRAENTTANYEGLTNNEEKVKEVLKTVGCVDETINSIYRVENIDTQNLKNNIMTLTNLGVTKLQLANILGNNWATIYMKNDALNHSIESIKNFFKDDNAVKEMIVENSKVICKDTEIRLNKARKVLDDFGISFDSQVQILTDNPLVMLLPEEQIRNSLTLIKQCINDDKKFITEITNQPIMVGISQMQVIKNYINSWGIKYGWII